MAAPPHSNTFEGGTDGVTITTGNSGGASGDAFNIINGTIAAFSSDQSRDTMSMEIIEPGTFAQSNCNWTAFGSLTVDVWVRLYVYMTAVPATNLKIVDFRTNTGAACGFLTLTTSGVVQVMNAAQSGTANGSVSFSLNQWIRLEARILPSTTVGTMDWWLYNTPDAPLGSHSETNGATGMVLGANVDAVRWGANTGTGPANLTFYIDDIADSTAGQIGPSAAPAELMFQAPRSGGRW